MSDPSQTPQRPLDKPSDEAKMDPADARRLKESRQALNNASQAEGVLRSSLATQATRARDHMMAGEADPNDPVEVWAKRTGRLISLVFLIGLAIYLAVTYVF